MFYIAMFCDNYKGTPYRTQKFKYNTCYVLRRCTVFHVHKLALKQQAHILETLWLLYKIYKEEFGAVVKGISLTDNFCTYIYAFYVLYRMQYIFLLMVFNVTFSRLLSNTVLILSTVFYFRST